MADALGELLPKIVGLHGEPHTWAVHPHESKQDLLGRLRSRLRGYATWMPADHRIVVLVDRDAEDCKRLKTRITQAVPEAGLPAGRVLARIVVEELEAWYFGDPEALRAAYPRLPATVGRRAAHRTPDEIRGGTWEALERELIRAGYQEGLVKSHAARTVCQHMDPARNTSHSFQVFRKGLMRLVQTAPARPTTPSPERSR